MGQQEGNGAGQEGGGGGGGAAGQQQQQQQAPQGDKRQVTGARAGRQECSSARNICLLPWPYELVKVAFSEVWESCFQPGGMLSCVDACELMMHKTRVGFQLTRKNNSTPSIKFLFNKYRGICTV